MSDEKIKRYEPDGTDAGMIPFSDGEYVKYDDIKHLLDRPSPWRPIAEIEAELEEGHELMRLCSEDLQCNCVAGYTCISCRKDAWLERNKPKS